VRIATSDAFAMSLGIRFAASAPATMIRMNIAM